jgi:hypothetical protein
MPRGIEIVPGVQNVPVLAGRAWSTLFMLSTCLEGSSLDEADKNTEHLRLHDGAGQEQNTLQIEGTKVRPAIIMVGSP